MRLLTRIGQWRFAFRRWRYALKNIRNYAADLNRRVKVEQELWNVANGRAPLPDTDQCADWARRLGVPEEARTKKTPH